MTSQRSLWWVLVVSALLGFACQCNPALARLEEKSGRVERDHSRAPSAWQTAAVGAAFGLGDGVQTLEGSNALVALSDGARLSMQENTLVRFSSAPPAPKTLAFELELGAATLSTQEAVSLQTLVGMARLEPGTRVTLARTGDGMRIVVQVGQAVIGDYGALGAEQGLSIDARGAVKPITEGALAEAPPPAPEVPTAVERAAPPAPVAALVRGRNASVYDGRDWARLPEGAAELAAGTELKLERNTQVELTRGDQRATLNQNGRYIVAPRDDVLVSASRGSLSAGSQGHVRIAVPGGVIVVAPFGKIDVQLRKDGAARLRVTAREAVVETKHGAETIVTGEQAALGADGQLEVKGRSLDYADIELAAGESVTIHDPSPPCAVRFQFGDACPEGGLVRLQGGRYAAGQGAVALAMNAGSHRYELRCGSGSAGPLRRGRVRVVKDGGTRALAVHPPATPLQVDGRHYTVLYQNRLPEIALSWPSPPASTPVRLVHEFAGESETLELSGPAHTFASGRLEEGKHVFHFAAGGKVSRRTSLDISFDNAAPAASLNVPPSVPARSGEALTVSGTVLPGWDVQVEGQRVQHDRQGRFSKAAVMPDERRALVIRISHPKRGTHLYLRRAAP